VKLLKFSGHSDDIFQYGEGENAVGGDEAYAIDEVHAFLVRDTKGEGFYVCAMYAPESIPCSCWFVGIAPLDQDVPLPHWTIRYEAGLERRYTPVLVIHAPDDVVVLPIAHD
jgi:hypothetical protein